MREKQEKTAAARGAVAFDGGSSRHHVRRSISGRFRPVARRQIRFFCELIDIAQRIRSRRIHVIHHLPPNGSVIQSVAFPPHAKGSIMPRTHIPLDPSLNSIMRPPCAKCDGQMMFTGIVSGPEGVDIRVCRAITSKRSPSRPTRRAGSHSAGSNANLTIVWVRNTQRAVSSSSSAHHPRCGQNKKHVLMSNFVLRGESCLAQL